MGPLTSWDRTPSLHQQNPWWLLVKSKGILLWRSCSVYNPVSSWELLIGLILPGQSACLHAQLKWPMLGIGLCRLVGIHSLFQFTCNGESQLTGGKMSSSSRVFRQVNTEPFPVDILHHIINNWIPVVDQYIKNRWIIIERFHLIHYVHFGLVRYRGH